MGDEIFWRFAAVLLTIVSLVCRQLLNAKSDRMCCVLANDTRFNRHDTRGDGNCLFNAISGLHFHRKYEGCRLRAAFIGWMQTKSMLGIESGMIIGSDIIQKSIDDLKNNRYGTEYDIMILSHMLSEHSGENIAIACFNARPTNKCPFQEYPANHDARWSVFAARDEEPCKCHFIQNFGQRTEEHFEALTPKQRYKKMFKGMTPQELRRVLNIHQSASFW